jgi:hypothetical protein
MGRAGHRNCSRIQVCIRVDWLASLLAWGQVLELIGELTLPTGRPIFMGGRWLETANWFL